ncbi:tryptophan--tRNA ligase [Defluviitalea phaphyphila]|uniref:tryptophan--tRNA ligase n=1 Tax=Defluviitalea phaphyphila TaxID=1473580 RepID=UPI000731764A|nr:tryptophan--tRNA ligase [Defluviitalea phaphyphila]
MTTETQAEKKKVIFSGMQPSGNITLGNYLGALKNWTKLKDEYNCLFCIVDLHALTVRQDPTELRKRSRQLLMQYIAAGLDPEKNIIYYQSHVSAHAELAWILNCYTYMGELNRMTQFKEKSQRHSENINAGLFTYPVLMAADILLYQTDLVPVGNDQSQHLELTRDVANRFNNLYGQTFTVPEGYFPKVGARIMSLQEPTKKMSKSDENPNAYIALLDPPDVIVRKLKRAVTDSEGKIAYNDNQPGIKNLINIYCSITEESIESTVERFSGLGYGDFKMKVAEVVVEELRPLQEKFRELEKDKKYIDSIIKNNAEKASYIAAKTLRKVKRKVGLPNTI